MDKREEEIRMKKGGTEKEKEKKKKKKPEPCGLPMVRTSVLCTRLQRERMQHGVQQGKKKGDADRGVLALPRRI